MKKYMTYSQINYGLRVLLFAVVLCVGFSTIVWCGVPFNPPREKLEIEIDADCNNNGYLAPDPFPDAVDDPFSDPGFETRAPAKLIPEDGERVPARINWRPVKGDGVITISVVGDISVYDRETGGPLLAKSGKPYSFSAAYTPRPRTVWIAGIATGSAKVHVTYSWKDHSASDAVRFTVVQVDLVAFHGVPNTEISEEKEENPGAYVGWNIDNSDYLVKLELHTKPALPSGFTSHFRLSVDSVYGRDGRIRLWRNPEMLGAPVIDGTGTFDFSLSGNITHLTNLYVEGKTMSNYAKDIKVTLERRSLPVYDSDVVYYSTLGIQPVKSRDEYETKLNFIPLVRKSFEIETISDVRNNASDMAWAIYLFQVGVGEEAGADIESYDSNNIFMDWEYGQNANGLNVEKITSAHYAGWDASQNTPEKQCGYVVDDASLKNETDTIQGEEGGTIRLRSAEAVTVNQICVFGNDKKVLASNLILRNVDDSSNMERFEIYVVENDDDDDNNLHPDNDDTAITGTIEQKAEDRKEMGLLTIKELTPQAARTSDATFVLKQENAGEPDAGKINLFRVDDDSLFWTSGSSVANLVGEWGHDLELRVEGVERGEVILSIEYHGNDVEWFDKAKITVVSLGIAMDGNRDGQIEFDKFEDQKYLFWVNDDWDIKKFSVHDFRNVEDDSDKVDAKRNCDDDTIGHYNQKIIGNGSCKRDLEDFTVVDIKVDDAFENIEDVTYWFRFDVEQGAPEANIFEAATNNTSYTNAFDYLSVSGVADEQIEKKRICTVNALEREINNDIIHPGKITRFLLEGKHDGKGDLEFIIKVNGKETCTRSVELDLQPITHFYDIYRIGGALLNKKWDVLLEPWPDHIQKMTAYTPENDKYLLIVHGWNVSPKSKRRLAETAFKRLWWQGYKGRLGLFDWPTLYGLIKSLWDKNGSNSDISHHYDNSEMIAWLSSEALARLLEDLNARGELRVLAHSMGNVVTGEALKKYAGSKNIHTYVATQAAISANAYDSNADHVDIPWLSDLDTPNLYGYWHSGNTNSTNTTYLFANTQKVNNASMFNYYNRKDWALDKWEWNNGQKPDGEFPGYRFHYNGATTNYDETHDEFYRYYGRFGKKTLSVTNQLQRYQIFAYCLESRSKALGQRTNASFTKNWNLETEMGYHGVHYFHSKQWRSNIVDEKKYYKQLIKDCGLK